MFAYLDSADTFPPGAAPFQSDASIPTYKKLIKAKGIM